MLHLWKALDLQLVICVDVSSASLKPSARGALPFSTGRAASEAWSLQTFLFVCFLMSAFLKNEGYQGFCTYISISSLDGLWPIGIK